MTSLRWWLRVRWDNFTHAIWLFRRAYSEALWRFLGEFFREASVLVLVFGFLERANKEGRVEYEFGRTICLISVAAFLAGIFCWKKAERAKKEKDS
jgi:hypothetical protein